MSNKKLKIVFNCAYFSFHVDYCINIKNELEKQGHIGIITLSQDTSNYTAENIERIYKEKHNDADFTILPDEACSIIGGKGIYINHALLPVIPQHNFYYEKHFKDCINKNTSYMFLPSQHIADLFINELQIQKPYKIVGFPKLDNIYKNRENNKNISYKISNNIPLNILYAPTGKWKTTMNSENIVNLELLNSNDNIIYIGHPAFIKSNKKLLDILFEVDIVISDYSSVGYDSIVLNIPTILIDNKHWIDVTNNSKLICEVSRNAAIRAYTNEDVINAINTYKKNPKFLEKERQYYSNCLSEYKENSSKKFISELQKLI
jgi:hypothetical protein